MKKFLLTLAAAACLTAAQADELTLTVADYDWKPTFGVNTMYFDTDAPFTFQLDGYSLTTTHGTVGSCYFGGYQQDLRIMGGGSLTIEAPAGVTMTSLTFNLSSTGVNAQSAVTPDSGTVTQAKESTTITWTGSAQTVKFDISEAPTYATTASYETGILGFKTINVVYNNGGAVVEKKDAGLAFDPLAVTCKMGENPVAPALTYATTAAITYTSSNEEVATVDATTGELTLVGAGETTITATSAENDEYLAGEASYFLTVEAADDPEAGKVATIIINDFTAWPSIMSGFGSFLGDAFTFEVNGFTLATKKESQAASPCAFRYQYKDLRVFDGNSLTITAPEGKDMVKIVFDQTVLGVQSQPAITVSAGEMTQTQGAETITWTGKANSVTFTIGGNDFGTQPDNMAVLSFPTATVTFDGQVGVEAIATENGTARYFNLQGVEVSNPEKGLYIRVADGKSTKVIIR